MMVLEDPTPAVFPPQQSRKRVLMVLTREIPGTPRSGRERTLGFIQRALAQRNDTTQFRLTSVAHRPTPVRFGRVLARLATGFVRGQPCPLQVALFFDGSDCTALLDEIERTRADVVYFDGIRTLDWLVATRRRYPQLRLICDFDDLMSLRFATLLQRKLPISLGYLTSATPTWLQDFLKRGIVTRQVLGYESRSLRLAERLAVEAADAVTVVSSTDIEQLRSDLGSVLSAKTVVIPPGVGFPSSSIVTARCREFVFVGSDSLLQNRLAIEFLLGLWKELRPATPLRIVGKMSNTYAPCEGVSFAGFVETMKDVYSSECIALCPSFIQGGIKTKVLEALGYGVIPVGNQLTFDGMGCDPGALAMTADTIRSFVCDPEPRVGALRESAVALRACVYASYSVEAVNLSWSGLVSPSPQAA